jgi:hypothetical protein
MHQAPSGRVFARAPYQVLPPLSLPLAHAEVIWQVGAAPAPLMMAGAGEGKISVKSKSLGVGFLTTGQEEKSCQ